VTRARPALRFLTLAWAALQLAAPALAGVADGLAFAESASGPRTHVEATTRESCPVVHSPDGGLCRYVTTSGADDASTPTFDWFEVAAAPQPESRGAGASGASIALPFGRAPPV